MHPSLLPDLMHLPVLTGVFAFALICVGIGAWSGARSAESALMAGWGVTASATIVVGTTISIRLSWVMVALALVGLTGVARIIVAEVRAVPILRLGMAGRVLLLAVPLVVGVEGMDTTAWDDFSHWLPNLAYLCSHGHFPTLTEPSASDHAAYPYGLALPGYASFLLLGRVPDDAAIIWNVIAMLAAAAAVATVLLTRLQSALPDLARGRTLPWAVAAIGLLITGLANPGFAAKWLFSNMADGTTGAVLAVMGCLLFEWAAAIRDGDARQRTRIAVTLALVSVALIDLRQANAALLAWFVFGCLLAGCVGRQRLGVADLGSLAIVVLLPLAVWYLWNRYAAIQIPGGQFALLPSGHWHWAQFPQTLRSMLHTAHNKGGLFSVILLICIRAALAFRARDPLDGPSRTLLVSAAVVCACNILFLAFTYLAANFNDDEAAAAASFWRYVSETGPLAVLGVVAGMPLAWLRRVPPVPATVALVATALIVPVAAVKLYRIDLDSVAPMLRNAARDTALVMPPMAPIQVVDLTGNGYAAIVVAYQIAATDYARGQSRRGITITSSAMAIPPEEAAKLELDAAPYIWLAEGAPEMQRLFGPRLSAGCSYLLRRQADGNAVMASWKLSRFIRYSRHTGWSPAIGASCL